MSVFPLLVIVHALAATVWTGGHLVLDLGVLPRALRAQSAAQVRAFEEVFEPLGLTALAIQVLTGLWMGWIYLPGFRGLFSPANPIGMLVGVKLLLLAGTAALALHARLRLIPNLTDANLSGLAWHIRGITALAIAFVVVGACGLVTRLIAPLLSGKDSDPAVVVVDPQGRFAVPLLGGHGAGADQLSHRIAASLGGQAVLTGASAE